MHGLKNNIKKNSAKLENFGGYEICPVGYMEAQIEFDSRINLIKFLVVKGKCTPILGLKSCLE